MSYDVLLERRYRDLVRLAYLILPGNGRRIYRLAIAQRIVDGCVPRGGRSYARMRTRVLKRAVRPGWRLRIGLRPWLRALPGRLPDPALTMALAEVDPYLRVAFVLREVEGMPRYAVRDQLIELGVRDPVAVLEAAERLPDVQRLLGGTVDIGPVRPVRHRSRLPLVVAGALTLLLMGSLVALDSGGPARRAQARQDQLLVVSADAWAKASERTLDVWPTRGDLVEDTTFTKRALRAWETSAGGARGGPRGGQLLFAGRVGDSADSKDPAVALVRREDLVVRYTEPGGKVEVLRAGGAEEVLGLGGGRYLVAPWVRTVQWADGDAVSVRDGVSAPVSVRSQCGRGALMRVEGERGASVLADLGGAELVPLRYRSPLEPKGTAAVSAAGSRVWERLACALPAPDKTLAGAVAWEFWAGELPAERRTARWVCTRYDYADGGGTAMAALIDGSGSVRRTGSCEFEGPVSGTWRRSGGRWYYLAAAAAGSRPHASGPIKHRHVAGRLLVGAAAKARHRPRGPVRLVARPDRTG
jgi:hypothetical protein